MPMGWVASLLDKSRDRGYKGAAEWWPLGVQGAMGRWTGAVCGWGQSRLKVEARGSRLEVEGRGSRSAVDLGGSRLKVEVRGSGLEVEGP